MKYNKLIAFIVMAIITTNASSFARIGESKLEIEKRFGIGISIPNLKENNLICETLLYKYETWTIIVKFFDNNSQYEKYSKPIVTAINCEEIMRSVFPNSIVVDKLGIQNLSPLNNNGKGNVIREPQSGYLWNLTSKSSNSKTYLLAFSGRRPVYNYSGSSAPGLGPWVNESPILSCQCDSTSVLICSPEYFKRTNTSSIGF